MKILLIGSKVYFMGMGLSFTCDAQVKTSPFAGGGAPLLIVYVVTFSFNSLAFFASEDSELYPASKDAWA